MSIIMQRGQLRDLAHERRRFITVYLAEMTAGFPTCLVDNAAAKAEFLADRATYTEVAGVFLRL